MVVFKETSKRDGMNLKKITLEYISYYRRGWIWNPLHFAAAPDSCYWKQKKPVSESGSGHFSQFLRYTEHGLIE